MFCRFWLSNRSWRRGKSGWGYMVFFIFRLDSSIFRWYWFWYWSILLVLIQSAARATIRFKVETYRELSRTCFEQTWSCHLLRTDISCLDLMRTSNEFMDNWEESYFILEGSFSHSSYFSDSSRSLCFSFSHRLLLFFFLQGRAFHGFPKLQSSLVKHGK